MTSAALDDLLRHPVEYAAPAEPAVEYGPPDLEADPHAAEAATLFSGAAVHADLDELSAAFAPHEPEQEAAGPARSTASGGEGAHAALPDDAPHDPFGPGHSHHGQPDFPDADDLPLPIPDF